MKESAERIQYIVDYIVSYKTKIEALNKKGLFDTATLLNTDNTPIYLRKPYGKMRPGCIYLRKGDRNTPDNSNALFGDIEMLWKKRFRLTKPPLEYIKNHLNNPLEWNETQDCYYNIFRPEYVLEHMLNIIFRICGIELMRKTSIHM